MAERLKKNYFEVLGLCCSSEVPLVERIMNSLDGVEEISVIVPTKTVIVVHDTRRISETKIVEALNKARLEATVRPEGKMKSQKKWPAPSVMASGLLLALSFLGYIYYPLQSLAVAAVIFGVPAILVRSVASIKSLTLNINVLVLMAAVGTLALGDYVEAGSIVFLFSISQWLESVASYKAMAAMSSLTSMAPQKAITAETGDQVDVNTVKVNTILAVRAGEVIPIDGIVVEGKCEVDEKTLTGESFPVVKEQDSPVWAGTINLDGYISIKTTALAKDCVVSRMAALVEESHKKKSRAQTFIESFAKYYIPAVLLISVAFAVIPAAVGVPNVRHWLYLAIVVLVSTCPCALILSTPVVIFCALSKAATTGLLVKGGNYLETLAKVKMVAFDKTGTVTRGEFTVTDFQSICDDVSLGTLLYWVSSIESKSSHPMAAALVDYARSLAIEPVPENVEDFQNFPGEGIFGKIHGNEIYIGNRRIGPRTGCSKDSIVEAKCTGGKTRGYVYLGATPVGTFSLSDSCRSGALEAIKDLKSLGIKSFILTGDSHAAALYAQDQLDHAFDMVYAELLPQHKAELVELLKKDGTTAMVGDGINDAPALAAADIGISMGISGSALAMETGHVILMSNDIRKIPKAIKLARKASTKLIQNVTLSVTVKGAVLALAIAGYPLVWAAVLTDVGTCLIVILNSMLLLKNNPEEEGGFSKSKYGTFSLSCKKDEAKEALNVKNCRSRCCEATSAKDTASTSLHSQTGSSPCCLSSSSCRKDRSTSSTGSQGENKRVARGGKVKKCGDQCCDIEAGVTA
ncbi:putative inactive cadmium/zinc-transporting ATPase HMA3 [Citrus clementina]|uniref:putative inactive cadmium/zinc-transporting ATPase HMA3 n=1 Tax=Citrus clementina TaxID=85681 RepID=UPI000CED7D44|nr:putative inactive cadmium/zinc-transporting ATPase HMA3 [Citrus x clementina]